MDEIIKPECAWVRIYYQGQRPRTGKCFKCNNFSVGTINSSPCIIINGDYIINIINEKFPKSKLFRPLYYDEVIEGFIELENDSIVKGFYPPGRINIVLEPHVHEPYSPVDTIMLRAIQSTYNPDSEKDREDSALEASQPRIRRDPEWRDFNDTMGWFGIGIVRGKCAPNHGTLWRSAYQLGASYCFSVGARYNKGIEDIANVSKTWAKIPFIQYSTWDNFMESNPYACPWVAVEMGGIPLPDFIHPTRAVYFLGAEDTGLPSSIIDHCHFHVSIPCIRSMSYNVSVAGSLIMYDRLQKKQIQVGKTLSPELQNSINQYEDDIKKYKEEKEEITE